MPNRIKHFRLQKRWSQQRLADEVGATSKQQMSKLERDQRGLNLVWLGRLAKAFGVRPVDLITEEPADDHARTMDAGSPARLSEISALSGKHGETIEQIRGSINQALVRLDPEMFPIALAAARRLVDVLERATAPEASSKSDPSSTSAS